MVIRQSSNPRYIRCSYQFSISPPQNTWRVSMGQGLVLNTCPMPSREANCPTSTSVFLAEILWLSDTKVCWMMCFGAEVHYIDLMNQRVAFTSCFSWMTPYATTSKIKLKRHRSFDGPEVLDGPIGKNTLAAWGKHRQVPRSVGNVLWLKDCFMVLVPVQDVSNIVLGCAQLASYNKWVVFAPTVHFLATKHIWIVFSVVSKVVGYRSHPWRPAFHSESQWDVADWKWLSGFLFW